MPAKRELPTACLIERRDLTPDLVIIRLEPEIPYTFAPGQYCTMVATVTGIAPFVSMLRFALHHGDGRFRFCVLQGASHQDEFAYRAELQAAAADEPHLLTYVPSVGRPGDERNRGWTGAVGRVNLIVEEHVERFGLEPESTLVYACGHPGMIADVAARLSPRGFTVKEERYWQE